MLETLDLFKEALLQCFKGIPLTIELTVLSVALGFCIAVFLAVLLQGQNRLIKRCINGFTFFFTGTPLLVQLYIFYYGIPEWNVIGKLMHTPQFAFLKEGFIWVLIALTLNTAAYSTVIFAGFIRNMDKGELEAAKAYGMSYKQAMRRIIVPSALRKALPAYSNEVIMTMHATALASVVTLLEVTGQANIFNQTYYEPFIAYGAAAVIYFVLNGIMIMGFKQLEKKYLKHLRVRRA
ncbi:ABC transporter permease [Brackiella oedipodis]|uniref:ABC transporter permease n=1 Tax=Brackiella oedipodis TaxID=124225 RepID=UPI00048F1F5E|nr:ABC transporter permease subunit [Brackiella oedipodis]